MQLPVLLYHVILVPFKNFICVGITQKSYNMYQHREFIKLLLNAIMILLVESLWHAYHLENCCTFCTRRNIPLYSGRHASNSTAIPSTSLCEHVLLTLAGDGLKYYFISFANLNETVSALALNY